MEGLGEEINTEVAVLASGSRGGDADHLAGAALEHEEIANADVVAGDGDSVGHSDGANLRPGSTRGAAFRAALTLDMVVVVAGLWVHNLVSQLVEAVAERVVVTCREKKENIKKNPIAGRLTTVAGRKGGKTKHRPQK